LDFQHLLLEGSNEELSGDLAVLHGHPDNVAGPDQPTHTVTNIYYETNYDFLQINRRKSLKI
jgi:hypothetical protein